MDKKQNLKSKTHLGELIKLNRKEAGLTQTELANMAGVGKTLVYDLEKGHTNVSFDKLVSVLNVLNIELSFLSPQAKR